MLHLAIASAGVLLCVLIVTGACLLLAGQPYAGTALVAAGCAGWRYLFGPDPFAED